MALVLGLDAKIFYGTAGSTATTELSNTRDVTLNLETAEADVTTRAAQGWRETVATLKDASVEWVMIYDTADAGFTAIKDAFFNNTAIALAVLDGVGGSGLDADFSITTFSRDEALEEALTVSITARPTRSTRAPAWI